MSGRFVKPSLDQLQAYGVEIGYGGFDAELFLDLNDMVGRRLGKARRPMKDWKAACRNWLRSPYRKEQKKTFRGTQELINTAQELKKEMGTW
jgi:hypothetical protein